MRLLLTALFVAIAPLAAFGGKQLPVGTDYDIIDGAGTDVGDVGAIASGAVIKSVVGGSIVSWGWDTDKKMYKKPSDCSYVNFADGTGGAAYDWTRYDSNCNLIANLSLIHI